ncbi:helix-turn-helix transcriptional regulator [Sphingobacterium sp. FBM7-1]|nr:helix-turn-helix transcriptional regulator [Sphingobacterium sp. FBM7-1]
MSFFTFSLLPQNSIGCITPKVLAKELKDLEEHQLIKRIVVDDYPVKILYKAEPYAKTITPIIEVLKTWGQNHRKKLFAGGKMDEVESVL